MKKIIMLLISFVIMLTGTVSTVSANENTDVSASELSDEEIVTLINQFIEAEDIPKAYASIRGNGEIPNIILSLDGDTLKNTFMSLISDFMDEKNIDQTKIFAISNAVAYKYWFRDVNGDDVVSVRDCAYIANALAYNMEVGSRADFNLDGDINVRDAATLAKELA